jgi:hypothetical protein
MSLKNELHRILEIYSEPWQAPHREAMEFWELQERLRMSLSLYDSIQLLNRTWGDAIDQGRGTWSRADAEEMHGLFSEWLRPSRELRRGVAEMEKAGFKFAGIERFREAIVEAGFATSMTVQETLDAIRDCEEGRGIPLAEIKDELRRKRLARGASDAAVAPV